MLSWFKPTLKEVFCAAAFTLAIPCTIDAVSPPEQTKSWDQYVSFLSLAEVPSALRTQKTSQLLLINTALFFLVLGAGKSFNAGCDFLESHHKFKNTPDEDKKKIAYHEAGHAVLSALSKYNTVEKATIMPESNTLGHILHGARKEGEETVKRRLFDTIIMAYGGRMAEEIILGTDHVDSGAIEDIWTITETAKRMVFQFGMGDNLPALFYGDVDYQGRKVSYSFSEATRQKVDEAIMKIANDAQSCARLNLEQHRDKLDKIAEALLKHRTLSEEQIYEIMGIDPDNPPGLMVKENHKTELAISQAASPEA